MTRSVYIIGGAGTGKSTFTAELTAGMEFGPLRDLHAAPNKKNVVTLRGHDLPGGGLYLGVMRDSFPGTDGLDRASSPVGEEWLVRGEGLPAWIVSEGSTLATRRFITALHEHTELLLVHLKAEDWIKELRFIQRGSNQPDQFVLATATRSANLLRDMQKIGVNSMDVDTSSPQEWAEAQEAAKIFLR